MDIRHRIQLHLATGIVLIMHVLLYNPEFDAQMPIYAIYKILNTMRTSHTVSRYCAFALCFSHSFILSLPYSRIHVLVVSIGASRIPRHSNMSRPCDSLVLSALVQVLCGFRWLQAI